MVDKDVHKVCTTPQGGDFADACGSFYGTFNRLKNILKDEAPVREGAVDILKENLESVIETLESKYPGLINPHLKDSIEEYKTHFKE